MKIFEVKKTLIPHIVGALIFALMPIQGNTKQIEEQTLFYTVTHRGSDAGELEIVIDKTTEGYKVTSISHLSLLAQMFLKGYTIESQYVVKNGVPYLVEGKEFDKESGELKRRFKIEYPNQLIRFSNGDPVTFDANTTIDADAFPLTLVLSDINNITPGAYLTVSPKRARLLAFQPASEEILDTASGSMETIKLVATRDDAPDNLKTIWLSNSSNPIPVKIVSGKPKKRTVIELKQ